MLSTALLISHLKTDYPQFSFLESDIFLWSPSENIINYRDTDDGSYIFILHELSHALLSHTNYDRDIELIAMECEAWDKALELANNYGLQIEDNTIQSSLDTYRNWLHSRSTCPVCSATGIQDKKHSYSCMACGHKWRVNDARNCALRRYKMAK